MKRTIPALLVFSLLLGALAMPVGAAGTTGFRDVSAKDYFYEPVSWAVEKAVTTGTTATTFSPQDTCTRAQILTFLWRAVGKPVPTIQNPFSDVKAEQYYYQAALWAYEKNMVTGSSFHGDKPCTRAEAVTYQWQLAGSPPGYSNPFTDVTHKSACHQAVGWAVAENITNGTSATTFSPNQTCTRGQIVTFLWRDLAEKQLYHNKTAGSSWTCTFQCAENDSYLSYSDRTLTLSGTSSAWHVKPAGDGLAYVYAGDTSLLLDIDNAWVRTGTTVKLWEKTGYTAQIWKIVTNNDGSVSFLASDDTSLCLGFDNGKAVLEKRKAGDLSQSFKVVCTDSVEESWCEFVSDDGEVILQLEERVFRVITPERLKQWANDLSKAYDSFAELTGFKPYSTVVLRGIDSQKYFAYVLDKNNTIYYDKDYLYQELAKMSARKNDWNFGALHEMGHMFDGGMPWNFEAECLTDLKIPYVMERNGIAAVPAEFSASTTFVGADIVSAYKQLGGDLSDSYSVYGLSYRFMEIKNDIGWEPFQKAFHDMQANASKLTYTTNYQRWDAFISLLGAYSGSNIRSYFSDAEWNCIIAYIDN